METTGERLKRWREASGLTQDDAARVFGATPSAYRKWEAGEVEPTGPGLFFQRKVAKTLERFEAIGAATEER